MPLGLFLINFDPISGMEVFAKAAIQNTNLTQEQVSSIFMSHASGQKPVEEMAIQLEGLSVASKYMERKKGNTLERLVICLVLSKGEKAEEFYGFLDSLQENIWNNIEKPQLKMTIYLQEQFKELTTEKTAELDAEVIKKRVIKRAQEMLDNNQIDRAQQLLSMSKSVPQQLVSSASDGFKFRSEKKYEKSTKSYEEAMKFAKMLIEPELAEKFKNAAKRSEEIPIMEKAREKAMDSARDHMRKEQFLKAANRYKEAAELSEKLDDIVGKEINQKKYEILSQFAEIDSL